MVLGSVMSKLGWKLVDPFECGLLRNKMNEFLATSLDGWLIINYIEKIDMRMIIIPTVMKTPRREESTIVG